MRYLLLTYYKKPNGQIDEQMVISKRIRLKDHQLVNVILDFKEQKVLKASMGDAVVPKDWDRIVSFYYQHYSATIERLFAENGHAVDIKAESTPTAS